MVVAIALGVGLRYVDLAWHNAGGEPTSWLFGGDSSAARSMLSAIATSLATIFTLLFSLTIVTLQLASTQYSPRLLQNFSRDRVVQTCLTVLLGTFVYSLVVLRNVRSASNSSTDGVVPRLSITVAVALTLASIAALITFIGHQVKNLRVEVMMREVHAEASAAIERLREERTAERSFVELPEPPPGARRVHSRANGFLQQVNTNRLVAALEDLGLVVLLDERPGDALIAGTPIGWTWTIDDGHAIDQGKVESALEDALAVGYERTDVGDPSYGLRKLADIAVRALSPGINDPTTAVHALSHISALLGQAGAVDAWHRRYADGRGTPRLFLRSWDVEALVDLAVTQIQHYGHADPVIADRLFSLLGEVAWRAQTARQRDAVAQRCRQLSDSCLRQPPTTWSAEEVRRRADAVERVLAEVSASPSSLTA